MSVANATFTRTNSFGPGGARNYPRFFIDSIPDEIASQEAGRPIFRDEERVEIIMPGNPLNRPVQKVDASHIALWPQEYAAFRKGVEISPEGTPIEQWPILRRSQVLELKALGFVTVEQVANMDDHAIQRIGIGGRNIRSHAQAFLDDAKAGELASKLQAIADKSESENASLRRQVEELKGLVNSLHDRLQTKLNEPNPILSTTPASLDPVEIAKQRAPAAIPASSSLGEMPAPRSRRKGAELNV